MCGIFDNNIIHVVFNSQDKVIMQGLSTEKAVKAWNEDKNINFRPSPNFKHMKKYLKSKFEESINSSTSNDTETQREVSNNDKHFKVNNAPNSVQPPLPPNPPPSESPPLKLKQEIEDDEYECSNSNDSTEPSQSEELKPDYKMDRTETSVKTEVTMCRNFVRGTCKRGGSCIFAHQIILSQLPGVFTFCKNFQNSVCTLPKCKFVHASVFEKEHFFRTGYLPPHTMSHFKEVNILQPPPPPPPPEETHTEPSVFSNHPPPPPTVIPSMPIPNCASTLDINGTEFKMGLPMRTSSKREWSDDFSRSPRDLDCSEPLAKKCKSCDSNEFRYQYNKNKLQKMTRSSEEMDEKTKLLNKKFQKLYTVLVTLLKSAESPGDTNGWNSRLNISAEKEKALLEQINLMTATNSMSFIREDNNNNGRTLSGENNDNNRLTLIGENNNYNRLTLIGENKNNNGVALFGENNHNRIHTLIGENTNNNRHTLGGENSSNRRHTLIGENNNYNKNTLSDDNSKNLWGQLLKYFGEAPEHERIQFIGTRHDVT